jgi:hypothetical protein
MEKFSLYKEASKCFEGRLTCAKAWGGRIGLAMVPTAALTTVVILGDPHHPGIAAVIGLLALFMALFILMRLKGSPLHAIGRRIVPDAGLMRIAQSRVVPNDIKREVAVLFRTRGAVRFNDLFEIDCRLRAQRETQRRDQDEQRQRQAEQMHERQRRQGAGAVALQAVLDDAKD